MCACEYVYMCVTNLQSRSITRNTSVFTHVYNHSHAYSLSQRTQQVNALYARLLLYDHAAIRAILVHRKVIVPDSSWPDSLHLQPLSMEGHVSYIHEKAVGLDREQVCGSCIYICVCLYIFLLARLSSPRATLYGRACV